MPGPLNQGWSDCDEAPQRTPGCHHASKRVGWSGKNLQFAPFFLFQELVSIFCLAGAPVDQFPLDVGRCAGGQLDEQDPESQHPPQVFFAVLLLNSTSD